MNPFQSQPETAIADTEPELVKLIPVLGKNVPDIRNPCPQLRSNVAAALIAKLKSGNGGDV